MDICERNRRNICSAWNKRHKKDYDYIEKTENKFILLKSRLCGFLVGDGNLLSDNGTTCRHNTIRFFPDDISLVNAFNEAMFKAYNKVPKVVKKQGYFYVRLESKPVVQDLMKLGKFGKLRWTVPSFVFEDNKNKIEWLRAYFDCEAHVHDKYIRVQSVNKEGLNNVTALLASLGINFRTYTYQPKNKNHNTVYLLTILRKEDQHKYLDLVGFNHTIKLKKLKSTLKSHLP
jgi:hypothetical protein